MSPSWEGSLFLAGYFFAADGRRLQEVVFEDLVWVSSRRDMVAGEKADAHADSQRLIWRHLLWRTVQSMSRDWRLPLRVKPLEPVNGGRRDGLLN